MKGKLYLSGGGNEIKTYALDKIFLQEIKKILYIPLAWKEESYKECKKWFAKMLTLHNKDIKFDTLTNCNRKINLKNYDAIYIGGGNTFKLLKSIKESGFDKKLVNYYKKGGTIYGGSAGAIIFGKDVSIALICKEKDKNKVKISDTRGMNLVKNFDIQCHFEDDQIKEHQEYIKKTKRNVIAIPEESALFIDGEVCKTIGLAPITIIKEKDSKKYEIGEIINL